MSQYILAAGLAASEVGGLMMVFGIIGLPGVKSWSILADVVLLLGLGVWLWWRRSPIAAGLMLALVAFEYWSLANTSGSSNSWLTSYLVLFLVAFAAHMRSPKRLPDRDTPTGHTQDGRPICQRCGEPIPEGKGILLTDDEKRALVQGRGVKSLPGAFRHMYGECAKPS
jgi:hypothetical protein